MQAGGHQAGGIECEEEEEKAIGGGGYCTDDDDTDQLAVGGEYCGGSGGGTLSTPLDADDEAGAGAALLQAQVQRLIVELQAAEERCVLVEAEVRQEVAEEMAQVSC